MRVVPMNINTRSYWEGRFSSGDWEEKQGRLQTQGFALSQVKLFPMGRAFDGVLVDFGCGLGDAIPVYRQRYPSAKLIGVDFSSSAIDKCREMYGSQAAFISGSIDDVPLADVIVASNVLEHITNDLAVVSELQTKCKLLIVIVPYKEDPLCSEHIRAYDESYFLNHGQQRFKVFHAKGWSEFGRGLVSLYVRNSLRFLMRRGVRRRRRQIIYYVAGSLG